MDKDFLEKKREDNPFIKLNDAVYDSIYNAIVMLEYQPGTKLVESKIAEELSVSRSPVKMAFQRLERENLVELGSGKSPRVAKIQYKECQELMEIRRAIEGYAAYYAAEKITESELHELKNALLQLKTAEERKDIIGCAHSDALFHQIVIDASHNRYIQNAYTLIRGNMLRYRLFIMRKIPNAELQEYLHHLPVYYALKHHSAILARDEMILSVEHMTGAMRFLD